ncbi:MAG: PAS domain S-box protein, partial [Ferruginibacter sp.]
EKTLQNRFRLLQGEILHNFCNRYITRNGSVIWLEWTSVYMAKREIILAIAKDITDRKKIEQEVEEQHTKFKGLASHFKTLLENDRKYFADELHEELAQLLAVINMDISWLNSQEAGFPDNVKDRISHASEVCRLMIQTIQRLAFSISPQMLDDLGLNATMEWLCTEFSVLHGIECSFEHHYDEHALTYEMKMDFFRISQETLSDILDHSQAGKITVSIKDVTHGIELMIHDNGYGFATDIAKQSNGLMSIRERAKSINGTIILQNDYMRGTSVSLLIEKQYSPVVTGFL